VHQVDGVAVALLEARLRLGDLRRRRLEGLSLHRVRSRVLLEALDPPRDQSFLPGWVLGEDERDRVPVAVADEAALEQRVDEPFRRLRADLPLRARAPTVAQVCANLSSTSSSSSSEKRWRWTVFQVDPTPRQSV